MSDRTKETIKNRGCPCGWPIDSCNPNPNFKRLPAATEEDCAKVKHDREVGRLKSKVRLEEKAKDHDREAAFYQRTADLIQVREE